MKPDLDAIPFEFDLAPGVRLQTREEYLAALLNTPIRRFERGDMTLEEAAAFMDAQGPPPLPSFNRGVAVPIADFWPWHTPEKWHDA